MMLYCRQVYYSWCWWWILQIRAYVPAGLGVQLNLHKQYPTSFVQTQYHRSLLWTKDVIKDNVLFARYSSKHNKRKSR
jgi:hypothetical protein